MSDNRFCCFFVLQTCEERKSESYMRISHHVVAVFVGDMMIHVESIRTDSMIEIVYDKFSLVLSSLSFYASYHIVCIWLLMSPYIPMNSDMPHN
jgi:hypothetical protein